MKGPNNKKGSGRDAPCGVMVMDKPAGMTSTAVLNRVKGIARVKKAGHAGTLDPFATGVLVCCLGRATGILGFLPTGDKRYQAVLRLGVETDTQDRDGRVTAENAGPDFADSEIEAALKKFTGRIQQAPPVYSALKHRGVPLYKLAREGRPFQKPAREVLVEYAELLEINLPFIRFEVGCSAGTYIRTLGADIGKTLGCGGHLTELRRTRTCGFDITEAVSLDRLDTNNISEFLHSPADALRTLPEFKANRELCRKISNGRKLSQGDVESSRIIGGETGTNFFFKVVDESGGLAAILKKEDGRYKYGRVFCNGYE